MINDTSPQKVQLGFILLSVRHGIVFKSIGYILLNFRGKCIIGKTIYLKPKLEISTYTHDHPNIILRSPLVDGSTLKYDGSFPRNYHNQHINMGFS